MTKDLRYTICCQLTLADLESGQVVSTRQVQEQVPSQTAELNEVFADLYEQFRSPQLLGLQITSIQCQLHSQEYIVEQTR